MEIPRLCPASLGMTGDIADWDDEGRGEEDYCPRCGAEVTGQRRCYECGCDLDLIFEEEGIRDGLSSEF